jgi:hypothetical protein
LLLVVDPTPDPSVGLPKALREALEFLAMKKEVDQLAAIIQEQIRISDPDADDEAAPTLELERRITINWMEGVEEYKSLTRDAVFTCLGYKGIPGFNRTFDPTGVHDPWSYEDGEWFKTSEDVADLVPRWHQLVGILKMTKCAFDGQPILLMDEVGLGKTMQVAGLIATLAYYRDYFAEHSRFPGIFCEGKTSILHFLSYLRSPSSQ